MKFKDILNTKLKSFNYGILYTGTSHFTNVLKDEEKFPYLFLTSQEIFVWTYYC